MMLKDAPGGPEFIERIANAIESLSLLYANTPDARAQASLDEYLGRIEPAIIEAVGATKAPILLDAFRRAVMTRKREIEASSGATLSRVFAPGS